MGYERRAGGDLDGIIVHNVGRPRDPWTQLDTRMMGFHDRVALSRMIRWTAFSDRSAALGPGELGPAVLGRGKGLVPREAPGAATRPNRRSDRLPVGAPAPGNARGRSR